MKSENNFNWWDLVSILAAVATFGIGWIADNESTVVAFVAVVIVYLLGKAFTHYKVQLGKSGLTIAVFLVAFILSFLIKGIVFPEFPAWDGDASVFAPLFIAWLSALLQSVAGVVAYATGIYNILLSEVLRKLPYALPSSLTILLILVVLFVAI